MKFKYYKFFLVDNFNCFVQQSKTSTLCECTISNYTLFVLHKTLLTGSKLLLKFFLHGRVLEATFKQ